MFTNKLLIIITSFFTLSAQAIVKEENSQYLNPDMAMIKGGNFTPFFNKNKDGSNVSILVDDFLMDIAPVTNFEFQSFTQKNPRWSKSNVKRIFAEPSYLKHWNEEKVFETKHLNQPVRFVSWFAASAYCESVDKELPTIIQWEYVAAADETTKMAVGKEGYRQKILHWYSRPSTDELADVKDSEKNAWGVYDLHGLVWEWNLDYNTALVTGESREDSSINRAFFCGSGALGAKDKLDYGAFMRFGFRSSLKGNYTIGNLGFRCVKNIEEEK